MNDSVCPRSRYRDLSSNRQTAVTTYWKQSVTQDSIRESIHHVYVAPCQDTQTAQTWITVLPANYSMRAFCFTSVHQMALPLTEVEGI